MEQMGNTEIIRAIVSLAEALAMTVTAEGVETAKQAAELTGLECGFGQGFYFCEPLTRDNVAAMLRERQAAPAK
jgi:EAL domain-containing protein (putative c-di-GMP-specific phosphodiesterase class I)